MEYLGTNGSYRPVQPFFGVRNSIVYHQEELSLVASDLGTFYEDLADRVP